MNFQYQRVFLAGFEAGWFDQPALNWQVVGRGSPVDSLDFQQCALAEQIVIEIGDLADDASATTDANICRPEMAAVGKRERSVCCCREVAARVRPADNDTAQCVGHRCDITAEAQLGQQRCTVILVADHQPVVARPLYVTNLAVERLCQRFDVAAVPLQDIDLAAVVAQLAVVKTKVGDVPDRLVTVLGQNLARRDR